MTNNEVFTVKGVEFKFIDKSAKNGGKTHVWAMNSENNRQTQVAIEDIDTPIESLAFQMGVDVCEVKCLAQSICNSLEKDKVSGFYVENANQQQKIELTQAYARHAVKKMNQFYTSYITNTTSRDLFNDMIFAQLKYDWKPSL